MGGGDLNMKKHFHPLTIENLERVWKAEDKKRKEDERIQQLQEELAAERQREAFQNQAIASGLQKKKSEKLDWMYSHQQAVNTEEYLLGRNIDKNVEVMKEDEDKTLATGQVNNMSSLPKASDILAKVKEDPLFLIKKREEDNRKDLVQNPFKLKKMKALLQQQMLESNEKSKKKKKRKHKGLSSDDEDERRYKKQSESRCHSDDRSHYQHRREHRKEEHRREESRDNVERSKRNGSRGDSDRYRESYKDHREMERRGKKHHDSRTTSTYHFKKTRGGNSSSDNDDEVEKRKHQRKTEREKQSNEKMRYKRRRKDSSSDDDEMEAKRLEMLNNAKWRQTQRSKNVKRYEKDRENEEKSVNSMLMKSDLEEDKAKFIKKMQKDSLMSSENSVEDRIRRTIHSKQRTNAALQKKFTSR